MIWRDHVFNYGSQIVLFTLEMQSDPSPWNFTDTFWKRNLAPSGATVVGGPDRGAAGTVVCELVRLPGPVPDHHMSCLWWCIGPSDQCACHESDMCTSTSPWSSHGFRFCLKDDDALVPLTSINMPSKNQKIQILNYLAWRRRRTLRRAVWDPEKRQSHYKAVKHSLIRLSANSWQKW